MMRPATDSLPIRSWQSPVVGPCAIMLGLGSMLMLAERVSSQEQAPNVVILLADDMGMGDTSAYQSWSGNSDAVQLHTPAMDRLARMGVRFTDAHSPHSRCTTSRYALMTGRYCWRTRLKHWVLFGVQGDPLLDRPRLTMPEFLQAADYQTGMVGKWHLGLTYRNQAGEPADGWQDADLTQPLADCPLDHGFDFFFGMSRSHGTSGPNGDNKNAIDQSVGPGWIRGRQIVGATGDGKLLDGSYRHDEVGSRLDREAFAFLQDVVPTAKPFFLYFASPANHTPYTPSPTIGNRPVAGASRFVNGHLTNSKRHDFIYQNDVHLARILDYLQSTDDPRRPGRPLIENTLVIFTSDNGADKPNKEFTGPLRSNKGSVYEGGHRIPFLASWPLGGIGDGDATTAGSDRAGLLALNDVYATLAEILSRPLPPTAGVGCGAEDSVSQLAALRGNATFQRPPVYPNDHKEASRKLADERAWVAVRSNATPLAGQWKLFLDHRYAFAGEIHPQELYNLADDPLESQNLIDEPAAEPAKQFLIERAKLAAGDAGSSRPDH
jgi:arylsulfatase A